MKKYVTIYPNKETIMRLHVNETMLIVVDIQERLLEHIHDYAQLERRMRLLLEGIALFDIPLVLNEQYPKGLGHTVSGLKTVMNDAIAMEKVTFSCCQNLATRERLLSMNKKSAIVFGIETHVCVLQTCLDLLEMGIQPFLVVDCVGSRKQSDHETAILRMVQAGVIPTTYESVLFEVCGSAKHPAFKAMSQLVK